MLRIVARFDDALGILEQAALYRAAADLDGLGRVIALIGRTHADGGTLDEGLRRMQPLLAALEAGGPSRGLAALHSQLATMLFVMGRYPEQMEVATRAADLARAVGDATVLARAESSRASALHLLGRLEEARRAHEGAIALAEEADNPELLGRLLNDAATTYLYMGRLETALRYVERAIGLSERHGEHVEMALQRLKRGIICLFTGDWRQTHADVDGVMSLAEQIGASWFFAYPLLTLGSVRMLEGAWDEATEHLEQTVAIAEASGHLESLRWAQSRLAEMDLLRGQPAAALERLRPVLDRPGLEETDVTVLVPRLAWAYLELGNAERATAEAARGVERARRQGHQIALADALWVQGKVATRLGQWDEATGALDEGLAVAQGIPYHYAEARLLHQYGLVLGSQGAAVAARDRLEAALAVAQRLGAANDAQRIERDLAALP